MDGYTSNLVLDLKNGIGMVVMTNQQTEQTYNDKMLELVFGQAQQQKAVQLKNPYYVSSARIEHGPLSYLELLFTSDAQSPAFKNRVLNKYYEIDQLEDGREVVAAGAMDNLAQPSWKVWLNYGSILTFVLALLYAVGHLIYVAVRWLLCKIKGKSARIRDKNSSLSLGLTLLLGGLSGHFIYQTLMMIATHRMQGINEQDWHSLMLAVLTPLAVAILIRSILDDWKKKKTGPQLPWKTRLHICLTRLAGLSIICFIYYWDLYQWWLI